MMKKFAQLKSIILILSMIILISCVPQRQYNDMMDKRNEVLVENKKLQTENIDLNSQVKENTASIEKMKVQIMRLAEDTVRLSGLWRKSDRNYTKLNKSYEQLVEKQRQLSMGDDLEKQKLLLEIQVAQTKLQTQEDELRSLEKSLDLKKDNLDLLKKTLDASKLDLEKSKLELQKSQADIDAKQKKVDDLEKILKEKDDAVNALRSKVQNALLGFEGQGLTIEKRNGKVYVSLEESLLFSSGSYKVNTKGTEAIKKLAKVLADNPEINILVEGHTDDVPYKGSGQIKDNWDLSMLRATAIVRIIEQNSSIDMKRVMAAGRGSNFPVDHGKTKEARAKNRRTEIILTPKLDELLQVIGDN